MNSFLLPFVLGGVFVLLSIDGVRVVFRGTLDYLSSSLSVNQRASKFAGTAAAIGCGVTGMALLITLAAWIGGSHRIGRWQKSASTDQDS
jgi:hypothetical protein